MSTALFFIGADLKFSALDPLPDITFDAGFTATAGDRYLGLTQRLLTADPLEDGPARVSSKTDIRVAHMAQNSSQIVSFPNGHSLEVAGKQIALRPDGRLHDLGDWSPAVADALAAKEGLTLMVQHWKVLHAMRDYYAAYNVSPVKKIAQARAQGCWKRGVDQ